MGIVHGVTPPAEKNETRIDSQQAVSRETGGVPSEDAPDQGSTTGTTPSGEFVGRVAGQDVGYEEETGAERRAREEGGES